MKESEKYKKVWTLTDLSVPDGSRDIPSQSRQFEQELAIKFRDCISVFLVYMIPLVPLVRVELHSLGLGVSVSPLVALVIVELHS